MNRREFVQAVVGLGLSLGLPKSDALAGRSVLVEVTTTAADRFYFAEIMQAKMEGAAWCFHNDEGEQ